MGGLALALAAADSRAQVAATGQGDQPIEITADRLTVRQNEDLAIFTGDVDAVQGTTSLKADTLRVFYTEGGATAAGAAAPGGGQNVRRIEAEGNVLLAEPTRTTAGDRGTYDVPAGKVVMTGNVVLTTKDNVIRGGRLDYDLTTGVVVVTPVGGDGTGRGQRVRALFQSQPQAQRQGR
jgi:lipopolysaccharide export system protein LptA